MKKYLLILALIPTLLVGCQKYSGGEPVDQEPKNVAKEEDKEKTPEETVTDVINDNIEQETFKGLERIVSVNIVKLENGSSVANIELNADERGSVERAVKDMHENAVGIFEELFKLEGISEVGLVWFLPLEDASGNEEQTRVMQIRLTKEKEISVENIETEVDQYFLHDALKAK